MQQGVTKNCRLSWLTNSPSYMSPNASFGGVVAGSPEPMSTAVQCAYGAQKNLGDLIPYVTFDLLYTVQSLINPPPPPPFLASSHLNPPPLQLCPLFLIYSNINIMVLPSWALHPTFLLCLLRVSRTLLRSKTCSTMFCFDRIYYCKCSWPLLKFRPHQSTAYWTILKYIFIQLVTRVYLYIPQLCWYSHTEASTS